MPDRGRLTTAGLAAAASALVLALVVLAADGTLDSSASPFADDVEPLRLSAAAGDLTDEPPRADGPTRERGAVPLRRAFIRATPGGERVTTVGRRTSFGDRTVLAVVQRQGDWLAVLHPSLPNGRAGWIRKDAVVEVRRRYHIEIERSARRATVRLDGRIVERFGVAVGSASTPTPVGRFAVTDRMVTTGSSPYGCCILALTGRQAKLPPGWPGGDRLAIHATPTGTAAGQSSAGCIRAATSIMRRLITRVPAGTRVDIVA